MESHEAVRGEAWPQTSPEVEALVREMMGRVADKWTLLILEVLEEHGTLRFTQVGERVGDISQKMLTKTLRQMEYDGLLSRRVHPVIPPRVDYTLTPLGLSLSEAFCPVWLWAEAHHAAVMAARAAFTAGKADAQE
ncbi:helix-turn-helix transcriptional regulator [Deinococcus sp. HMF7604]|uniref:winged helix-turn-helix transcriptional regulator n=1 Tax=Deinococcus betulae TaxID=2873312 RepID=UPI001CCDEBF3|nr:helix-turn-helix domain-containing protein [Deinococcus betulae]MBZ9750619.1 helix-turn-helix transcriptional regulator [Deinococcus betulae]